MHAAERRWSEMQGLICAAEQTIGVSREAAYFRQLIVTYELGNAWFEMQTYDYFSSRDELLEFHRRLNESRDLLRRRPLYVRYERLVFQPRETLREVFRFLDLPFREETAEAAWPIKRGRGEESASELDGQPISSSPVGKYQSALDRALLDSFARQMARITAAVGVDCFAAADPRNEKRFPNTEMVD